MGFLGKGIQPNVMGEMIDKNYVVVEAIGGGNRELQVVKEEVHKQLGGGEGRGVKWKFVHHGDGVSMVVIQEGGTVANWKRGGGEDRFLN